MKLVFISSLVLFLSTLALAHSRFLPTGNTPGRSNSAGLKTGPCGGVAKNPNPTLEFQMGQTIKLQWEETINHPGRFEFFISTDNDQTFQLLLTVPDTQDNSSLPHLYEADLKLPDGLICTSCTLRMIQQMTENPASPRPYYSCADIKIVDKVNPTPPNPLPPINPTPDPSPDCH